MNTHLQKQSMVQNPTPKNEKVINETNSLFEHLTHSYSYEEVKDILGALREKFICHLENELSQGEEFVYRIKDLLK